MSGRVTTNVTITIFVRAANLLVMLMLTAAVIQHLHVLMANVSFVTRTVKGYLVIKTTMGQGQMVMDQV